MSAGSPVRWRTMMFVSMKALIGVRRLAPHGSWDHVIPGDVGVWRQARQESRRGTKSGVRARTARLPSTRKTISSPLDTERIKNRFGDSHLALDVTLAAGIHRDLLTDKMK